MKLEIMSPYSFKHLQFHPVPKKDFLNVICANKDQHQLYKFLTSVNGGAELGIRIIWGDSGTVT